MDSNEIYGWVWDGKRSVINIYGGLNPHADWPIRNPAMTQQIINKMQCNVWKGLGRYKEQAIRFW